MSLRINTKPRRQNSHKADAARRCRGHLQWLRSRPCLLADQRGCFGRIVAAHVDHAGGKGMALKVSDFDAVPLCHDHHVELHQGAQSFEARYSIDLVDAASSSRAARTPAAVTHRRAALMAADLTVARTSRGFPVARGLDRYGQPWSIQDSSLAGEPCIWLGSDGKEAGRAHLTRADATALIPLLHSFVRNGSIAS